MTDQELTAIRSRVEAATPGPWETGTRGGVWVESTALIRGPWISCDLKPNDAAFIAHARQDVPGLLDDIDVLREANRKLRERNGELETKLGEAHERHRELVAAALRRGGP